LRFRNLFCCAAADGSVFHLVDRVEDIQRALVVGDHNHNVLWHNSFVRSRTDGVRITGNRPADEQQSTAAILGTIAEFNVVRDASVGYRVARSAEATLLRRNHPYFWYPVNQQPGPRVAFQVANEKAAVALELNSVEGIHGGSDRQIVPEQRGPAAPAQ
jgi:hypothetical protein